MALLLLRSKNQKNPFAVKRNDVPITEYPLRHSVNVDIKYAQSFLEWEAAHEAGLSLWNWDNGRYSVKFMAKVIAWYKLHNLVKVHSDDAASIQSEREARKKRKK